MTAVVVQAANLHVGDVVHRGNHSMRVVSIDHAERTTRWVGQYTQCAFDPARVGTIHHNSTRKTTLLTVSRPERITLRSEILEVLREHEWQPDVFGCTCRDHGAVNAEQHREHVADLLTEIHDHFSED